MPTPNLLICIIPDVTSDGNHTKCRIPLPSVFNKKKSWLHESVPTHWLESIEKLRKLDVDAIVPGHGDVCKKDYLDEQASIIRQWVEVVQSAIKHGLSVEEATDKITTPDPYPKQLGIPIPDDELHKMIVARLYKLYSK